MFHTLDSSCSLVCSVFTEVTTERLCLCFVLRSQQCVISSPTFATSTKGWSNSRMVRHFVLCFLSEINDGELSFHDRLSDCTPVNVLSYSVWNHVSLLCLQRSRCSGRWCSSAEKCPSLSSATSKTSCDWRTAPPSDRSRLRPPPGSGFPPPTPLLYVWVCFCVCERRTESSLWRRWWLKTVTLVCCRWRFLLRIQNMRFPLLKHETLQHV